MSMVFCRGCAQQIHSEASTCPGCGAPQAATTSAMDSLNKKFHITLIAAAAVGIVLLYTTQLIPLIGLATGLCFGLSLRLFLVHKKNNFAQTKKLDWMLLVGFSSLALILMLASFYSVQAPALIFVAVRALIMYFTIYSEKVVTETIHAK
jgi:hypothetical protein